VRSSIASRLTAFASLGVLAALGCSRSAPAEQHLAAGTGLDRRSEPLVLGASQGERRLHRPPPGALSNLTAPLILKVDRKNGGAPEFVMLTEDIPPGQAIAPHRHPHSDEILFIHGGTGLASLAGRETAVKTGATIYMPRDTVVGLRNTGTEPLRIVAIFSQPGYEEYLREISVPDGQTPTPLTTEELTAIRKRHLDSAVYEPR